jgi:response regulator of citrate/malate metabolism
MEAYRFNCVLLVDDDGVTNFINHRLIKKMNLTDCIQSAVNGNNAINFIKEFPTQHDNCGPELILLDINMLVLDGFEFMEQFKTMNLKNSGTIKIIVLTNSTHQKDILKISQNTKIGYINKPLTQEKLEEALKNSASNSLSLS